MQTATNATFGGFTLSELKSRGFRVQEATAYTYSPKGVTLRLMSPDALLTVQGLSQEDAMAVLSAIGFYEEVAL